MALRPIVKFGASELDTRCEEITDFEPDLEVLAKDMVQTMYAAPGVGLAANQIGLTTRLPSFLFHDELRGSPAAADCHRYR